MATFGIESSNNGQARIPVNKIQGYLLARKTRLSLIFLALLLPGVILSFYGLIGDAGSKYFPARNYSSWIFMVVVFLALLAGVRFSGRSPAVVASVISALIALLANQLWPLLVVALFFVSSFALGCSVLDLFGKIENKCKVTTVLIGSGIYASIVGIAAHFPINYQAVYFLVILVPLLLKRRELGSYLRDSLMRLPSGQERGARLLEIAFYTIALLYFSFAFLPELGHDALAMHLFIPSQIADFHKWGFNPALYVWSLMPMLGDWHFTIGYMLGGESGARLVNVAFVFIIAYLLRQLVLWANGSQRGAALAMLLLVSTSATYGLSISLLVELIWTSYFIAGVFWFLEFLYAEDVNRQRLALILSALMLGFAVTAKAITLNYISPLILIFFFKRIDYLKTPKILFIFKGVGLFLAIGLIPYAVAFWKSGNPIFPFYNAVFKSPYYPSLNFNNTLFNQPFDWRLIYDLTFFSNKYLEGTAGSAGFQWLLLLIPCIVAALLFFNKRIFIFILVGALSFCAVFIFQSYIRYLFPALVIFLVVIGAAARIFELPGRLSMAAFYTVSLMAVSFNLIYLGASTWGYRDVPISQVFAPHKRDNLILRRKPLRTAVEFVNMVNTDNSPVVFFAQPVAAKLRADALHANWYNPTFGHAVLNAVDAPSLIEILKNARSRYIILDPAWGTPKLQAMALEVGNVIATFNNVSVLELKPELYFSEEHVKNSEFNQSEGWSGADGAIDTSAGTVLVNGQSPMYQRIAVQGNEVYLNTALIQCVDNVMVEGKLQINWLDKKDAILQVDIKQLMCGNDWQVISQKVVAPNKAVNAILYISSAAADKPVEVSSVSLKSPLATQ